MRAVWFIGKFELHLDYNKIQIIHPNPAHRNSRKTLAATAFQGFALTIFQVVFNLEWPNLFWFAYALLSIVLLG